MSLWSLFFGKRVKRGRLNYETLKLVEDKWPGVEEALRLGTPSNLKQAVIEADKLTDYALRQLYPNEKTMGERLKVAKERFINHRSSYEDLWYAHKIRNEIVHNPNFNLPSLEVRSLIDKFAAGLEILGAKR
jgi:hypothetical protein